MSEHVRPTWDEYFMEIAFSVAERSTCDRAHVGAVLVRDRRILTTGYNGAPAGLPHCLPGSERVRLASGASLQIYKIYALVNAGETVTIYSYDFNINQIVARRILQAFRTDAYPREWLRIKSKGHRNGKRLYVSSDHVVYSASKGGWLPAGALQVGDTLRHDIPAPTEFQCQVMLGCSLGDGSTQRLASWKSYLQYGHSIKQKEYALWKAAVLSPFSSVPAPTKSRAFGRDWEQIKVYTKVNWPLTSLLLASPSERAAQINAVGLAIWYQDDGTLKSYTRPHLCTYGWEEEEVKKIAKALTMQFGLHFHPERHSRYWGIRICNHSKDDFFGLIAPYIHPTMQYKLPENYRTGIIPYLDDTVSPISDYPIETMECETIAQPGYDLEVEGTHNFFTANGVLISNCDDVGHLIIDGHCVRTLHAEQNAIIQAALHGVSIQGASAYVTHQPCLTCAKMLINSGVKRVVYAGNYPDENSRHFLHQAGVELSHLPRPRGGDTVYHP